MKTQTLRTQAGLTAVLALIVGVLVALPARAGSKEEKRSRQREALNAEVQSTVELFKKADPDMKGFFEKAAGYAVFPRIAKGAAGIGAAHGSGLVFEKGMAVGSAKVTQVTIGFQLGGQVYAEVIFFENQDTLRSFQDSDLKFSAQVSAVAAAEGASKNAKYELGVAVFTLARGGLMYEASVGGQKFGYEPDPVTEK